MKFASIAERILSSAEELFFRFGFTKTTAEDIARESSVSKRTLYKYYRSKDHILQALISKKTQELSTELNKIIGSGVDFQEKLHSAMTVTTKALSKVSRPFIDDIQRNVPDVWQQLSKYRRDIVTTVFVSLLDEGLHTGYVKKKINRSVAVLVMLSVMDNLINASVDKTLPSDLSSKIPQNIDHIFDDIITIINNGILNDSTAFNKKTD